MLGRRQRLARRPKRDAHTRSGVAWNPSRPVTGAAASRWPTVTAPAYPRSPASRGEVVSNWSPVIGCRAASRARRPGAGSVCRCPTGGVAGCGGTGVGAKRAARPPPHRGQPAPHRQLDVAPGQRGQHPACAASRGRDARHERVAHVQPAVAAHPHRSRAGSGHGAERAQLGRDDTARGGADPVDVAGAVDGPHEPERRVRQRMADHGFQPSRADAARLPGEERCGADPLEHDLAHARVLPFGGRHLGPVDARLDEADVDPAQRLEVDLVGEAGRRLQRAGRPEAGHRVEALRAAPAVVGPVLRVADLDVREQVRALAGEPADLPQPGARQAVVLDLHPLAREQRIQQRGAAAGSTVAYSSPEANSARSTPPASWWDTNASAVPEKSSQSATCAATSSRTFVQQTCIGFPRVAAASPALTTSAARTSSSCRVSSPSTNTTAECSGWRAAVNSESTPRERNDTRSRPASGAAVPACAATSTGRRPGAHAA